MIAFRSKAVTYRLYALRPIILRARQSILLRRIAKGAFWTAFGAFGSRGLILLASIFIARLLGQTAFGELGMVRSTITTFGVFAGLGLGITATRHVAKYRDVDPESTGRVIAVSNYTAIVCGLALSCGLAALAPWLATTTLKAPQLAVPLQVGALILLLSAITGAQFGALSGFEAFKTIANINLATALLGLPLLLAFTRLWGVAGALWATAGSLFCTWILNKYALTWHSRLHNVPTHIRPRVQDLSIVWRYGVPAALAGALVGPTEWICHAIIVNTIRGYDEMAVLSVANQWSMVLLFLPSAFGQVLLPIMAREHSQGSRSTVRAMSMGIGINLVVVLPCALLAAFLSPFIMRLYGPAFEAGWATLCVTLATSVIVSACYPLGQFITATGDLWIGLAMNVGWASLYIGLTLAFSEIGSLGIALARFVAYVVHGGWVAIYAIRIYRKCDATYDATSVSDVHI